MADKGILVIRGQSVYTKEHSIQNREDAKFQMFKILFVYGT